MFEIWGSSTSRVKLQSWFPCQIQVYVNGHEWLARQLERHRIKYTKLDNAFVRLSDAAASQRPGGDQPLYESRGG